MSDILKLVGAKIREVERGERNVTLTNLAKIADCLNVELFEYVSINRDFSEKEKNIRGVLEKLIDRELKEINMINNIIKEIFDTYEK